jgi:GNAT superfamily N-acetyltransferase
MGGFGGGGNFNPDEARLPSGGPGGGEWTGDGIPPLSAAASKEGQAVKNALLKGDDSKLLKKGAASVADKASRTGEASIATAASKESKTVSQLIQKSGGRTAEMSGLVADKNGTEYAILHQTRIDAEGNIRHSFDAFEKDKFDLEQAARGNRTGWVAGAETTRSGASMMDVQVEKDFQRRGIATSLYSHAEDKLGHSLVANNALTEEGKAFWAARGKIPLPGTEAERAASEGASLATAAAPESRAVASAVRKGSVVADAANLGSATAKDEMKAVHKIAPDLVTHTQSDLEGFPDKASLKNFGGAAPLNTSGEARVVQLYRDAKGAESINDALRSGKGLGGTVKDSGPFGDQKVNARIYTGRQIVKTEKDLIMGGVRKVATDEYEYKSISIHDAVEMLDGAIAKSTVVSNFVAYRNMGNFGSDMRVGDIFVDKGFVSTTLSPKYAVMIGEHVAGGKGLGNIARITGPAGSNALYADQRGGKAVMSEMILPRGTKFRVDAIEGSNFKLSVVK